VAGPGAYRCIYVYDYVTLSQGNQKRLILPTSNGDIMRTIMFGI